MPYYRFRFAQIVTRVLPGMPAGPLVIDRLLPLADDEPQCRVMGAFDGHQRTILESHTRPMPMQGKGQEPTVLVPPRTLTGVIAADGAFQSADASSHRMKETEQ